MNELSEQVANLSSDQHDLLVAAAAQQKKKEVDSRTEVMAQSRETDAFPLSFAQQANEKGFQLSPQLLFNHPTVAMLTTVAGATQDVKG